MAKKYQYHALQDRMDASEGVFTPSPLSCETNSL